MGQAATLAEPEKYKHIKDFDWTGLDRGCDGQLTTTERLIDGSEFSTKLDRVIRAAQLRLSRE
jgi:hypothetical protein